MEHRSRLAQAEVLDGLKQAVDESPTPHQRRVFVALAMPTAAAASGGLTWVNGHGGS